MPELRLNSVELGPAVEQAELVAILTAHPDVDHKAVESAAFLVLDFREFLRRSVAWPAGQRA